MALEINTKLLIVYKMELYKRWSTQTSEDESEEPKTFGSSVKWFLFC